MSALSSLKCPCCNCVHHFKSQVSGKSFLQVNTAREIFGVTSECPVCLNECSSLMALPCGHILCKDDYQQMGGMMPASFGSTTQTTMTYTTGVGLQLRFQQFGLSPAPYLPSSTVATAGSSGINTTSTHETRPFSFQRTQTMLNRPATLSGAHVNVPSAATAVNGASVVAAAPAPYPPSSTIATTGLSGVNTTTTHETRPFLFQGARLMMMMNDPSPATAVNGASDVAAAPAPHPPPLTVATAGLSSTSTTSTHGTRPFSFQPTQTMLNRIATLSGARVNVPSSATAVNEAHGASGAVPQAEPTGGLSLPEGVRSSIPTRRVTRSSAASANVPSNGSNASRRSKRTKRPAPL